LAAHTFAALHIRAALETEPPLLGTVHHHVACPRLQTIHSIFSTPLNISEHNSVGQYCKGWL